MLFLKREDSKNQESKFIPDKISVFLILTWIKFTAKFFTSLNFDARPLIPKNYGVGLTSGPLSAIGGVLGWGLSKSFLVARVSNFYYVFLLQIIFSYFLAKQYKLNLKNLIIFYQESLLQ